MGTATRPGRTRTWLRFEPVHRDPPPRWQRVTGGVLVGVGAVELALLGGFLIPLHLGSVPVPLSVVIAIVGNVIAPRVMYAATLHRMTGVIPVGLWLLVVLALSTRGPGGDLVVPGTMTGLAFLFLGTMAGAFAAGQVLNVRPAARRR